MDHIPTVSARATIGADVVQWLKGQKDWTGIKIAPVRIENHAWLGFNVSILPGVVVGEGAVIGCVLAAHRLTSRSGPLRRAVPRVSPAGN